MSLEKLEAAKKARPSRSPKPNRSKSPRQAGGDETTSGTHQGDDQEGKEEIKASTATAANANKEKDLNACAEQADVEDQTKELSRDAASKAPEAAQSIGDAMQQMDKSQQNLAKPQQQAPKTPRSAGGGDLRVEAGRGATGETGRAIRRRPSRSWPI